MDVDVVPEQDSRFARDVMAAMEQVIVGQRYLLERLLIGLLANGHVLLEGVPGPGQDAGRDARLAQALARGTFSASSSRRTCCRPT